MNMKYKNKKLLQKVLSLILAFSMIMGDLVIPVQAMSDMNTSGNSEITVDAGEAVASTVSNSEVPPHGEEGEVPSNSEDTNNVSSTINDDDSSNEGAVSEPSPSPDASSSSSSQSSQSEASSSESTSSDGSDNSQSSSSELNSNSNSDSSSSNSESSSSSNSSSASSNSESSSSSDESANSDSSQNSNSNSNESSSENSSSSDTSSSEDESSEAGDNSEVNDNSNSDSDSSSETEDEESEEGEELDEEEEKVEEFVALGIIAPESTEISAEIGTEVTLSSKVNRDDVQVTYQWQKKLVESVGITSKDAIYDYYEDEPTWYSYIVGDWPEAEYLSKYPDATWPGVEMYYAIVAALDDIEADSSNVSIAYRTPNFVLNGYTISAEKANGNVEIHADKEGKRYTATINENGKWEFGNADSYEYEWQDIEGATEADHIFTVFYEDYSSLYRCIVTVIDEEYKNKCIEILEEQGVVFTEEEKTVEQVLYSCDFSINNGMISEDYEIGEYATENGSAVGNPKLSDDAQWIEGLTQSYEYITKDTYDRVTQWLNEGRITETQADRYWTGLLKSGWGGKRQANILDENGFPVGDESNYRAYNGFQLTDGMLEVNSEWYGKTVYFRLDVNGKSNWNSIGSAINIPAYTDLVKDGDGNYIESTSGTRYKKAITVLNPFAIDAGSFYKQYVAHEKITTGSGWLVDDNGNRTSLHITVVPIRIDNFNAQPEQYMLDAEGNYRMDAVAWGPYVGYEPDISGKAYWVLKDYLANGYGFLVGHDSMYGYAGAYYDSFRTGLDESTIDPNDTTTWYYDIGTYLPAQGSSWEFDGETGEKINKTGTTTSHGGHWYMNQLMGSNAGHVKSGTVDPLKTPSGVISTGGKYGPYSLYHEMINFGSDEAEIVQTGYSAAQAQSNPRYRTPTNYPYAFSAGQEIGVTFTHSNQQAAFNTIWAKFANDYNKVGTEEDPEGIYVTFREPTIFEIGDSVGTNNFYLTGEGNFLMNQVGHLSGNKEISKLKVAELKLFANSLFYISQRKQCEICAANQNGQETVHYVHRVSAANADTILSTLQAGGNYWYGLDDCYMLIDDITLPEDWTAIANFTGHWNSDVYDVTLNSKGTPLLKNTSGTLGSFTSGSNLNMGWNLGTDRTQGLVNVFKVGGTYAGTVSTGVARVVGDLNDLFKTTQSYAGYTVKILGSDNTSYLPSDAVYSCTVNTDNKYVISNLPCIYDASSMTGILRARVYAPNGTEVTQYGTIRVNVDKDFWDNDMTTPLYLGSFTSEPVEDEITYEKAQAFFEATATSEETISLVGWQYRVSSTGSWINVPSSWNTTVVNSSTTTADGSIVFKSKLTLNDVNPAWNGYEFRAVFTSANHGQWNTYEYYVTGITANASSGTLHKMIAKDGYHGKLTVKLWPAFTEQSFDVTVYEGDSATFVSKGFALDDGTAITAEWQYGVEVFDAYAGKYVTEWHTVKGNAEFGGLEVIVNDTPVVGPLSQIIEELAKVSPDTDTNVFISNAKFHTLTTSLTVNKVDIKQDKIPFRVHYTATSSYGTKIEWYSDIANEKSGAWNTDSGTFGDYSVNKIENHSNILGVNPPELFVNMQEASLYSDSTLNLDNNDKLGQSLVLPSVEASVANGTAVYRAKVYYLPSQIKPTATWQYRTYKDSSAHEWTDAVASNLGYPDATVKVENTDIGTTIVDGVTYNVIESKMTIANVPLSMYNMENQLKYFFRCIATSTYTTVKEPNKALTKVDVRDGYQWGGLTIDYNIDLNHNGVLGYDGENSIKTDPTSGAAWTTAGTLEEVIQATQTDDRAYWRYPKLEIKAPSGQHINTVIVWFDDNYPHSSDDYVNYNESKATSYGISVSEKSSQRIVFVSTTENTVELNTWNDFLRNYVWFVTYDEIDYTDLTSPNSTVSGGAKIRWYADEFRFSGLLSGEARTEYKVVTVPGGITWADAKAAAEAYNDEFGTNGKLVEINSVEENTIVKDLLAGKEAWIGATKTSGSWKWAKSGNALSYTNWASGEPSSVSGRNYTAIKSDGSWVAYSNATTETKNVTVTDSLNWNNWTRVWQNTAEYTGKTYGTSYASYQGVSMNDNESSSNTVYLINGHKYYINLFGGDYGDSNQSLRIIFSAFDIDKYATNCDARTSISQISTFTKTTGNYTITVKEGVTGNNISGLGTTLNQGDIIDLTAIFGAGNEPSIDWCRANLYGISSKTVSYSVEIRNKVQYYVVEYNIVSPTKVYEVVLGDEPISWHDAKAAAEAYNPKYGVTGKLAEITSAEENARILELNGKWAWFGGTKESGSWKYANSGKALSYTNWSSTTPGNGNYTATRNDGTWTAYNNTSTETKNITVTDLVNWNSWSGYWILNNESTGYLWSTGNRSYDGVRIYPGQTATNTVNLIKGHKYFINIFGGDNGDSNTAINLSFPAFNISITPTSCDEATKVSQISTYTGTSGNQTITISSGVTGHDHSGLSTTLNQCDIIDLTATFGDGNEPDINWCRENIHGISSKTVTTTVQNITNIKNYIVEYDISGLGMSISNHSAADFDYIGMNGVVDVPEGPKTVAVTIEGDKKVYDKTDIFPKSFTVSGSNGASRSLFDITYTLTSGAYADYTTTTVNGMNFMNTGAVNTGAYRATVKLTAEAIADGWVLDEQGSITECDLYITSRPIDVYSYNNNKVYDGTSDGTIKNITFKSASGDRGVISGDTVKLNVTTVSGYYTDNLVKTVNNSVTNSSTGKWVMLRDKDASPMYVIHDTTSDPHHNYYLDNEDYSGAITQRPVIVHSRYLDDPDNPRNIKEYDSTKNAIITNILVDNVLEGDNIGLAQDTLNGLYSKAEAGEALGSDGKLIIEDRYKKLTEYTITASTNAQLSGNEKGNYYIEKEEYSGAIYRAMLELSVDSWRGTYGAGMSREIWASAGIFSANNTKPSFDGWLTIIGLKGSDTLTIDTTKSRFVAEGLATPQIKEDTDVGFYELTYEGLTQANYPVLSNYYVYGGVGTLNVEPREIVVQVNDTNKMVGDNNPPFFSSFFFTDGEGELVEIGSDESTAYSGLTLVAGDTVADTIVIKKPDGTTTAISKTNNVSNIPYATLCTKDSPVVYLSDATGSSDKTEYDCEWCTETSGRNCKHQLLAGYEVKINTVNTSNILDVAFVTNAKGEQVQNYTLKVMSGAIEVHPITVKLVKPVITGNTKVYDKTEISPASFTVTGDAGASANLFNIIYTVKTGPYANYAGKTVSGSNYTDTDAINAAIYHAVVTLTDAARADGWEIDAGSVTECDLTITQRPIDVYSNNNDKVYNGSSSGTIKNITIAAASGNRGVISGDTVTLNTTIVNGFYTTNGSTKTANNSITNNSGNDWTMIRDTATSPLSIVNNASSDPYRNYYLANETYTGGITQRYVDVYSNNNDKVYDRTSNGTIKNIAFVAPTADRGVISGDTVTLNTTTVNGFYTTNGSTKTANNSITNNSGNDWTMIRDTATSPLTINSSYNNYLLGNESYTGGIAQRPLDVYSYDNNKVYDGTSDGTIKNIKFKTATTGRGVVSGDTVALSTTTVSGTYMNGSTAVKDNSVTNSATGKWDMVRKSTSALTLTNNPNSNYYLDVEDYDGAIAQRYVDVYSNNNDKVYDRTSNGTIKNIAFVAPTADRGVISGDTVTLNTTTVNGFYTTNGSTKTANNSITNNSGNDWTMIRDTATSPLTINSSYNNYLLGNETYTGGIAQRPLDVYSYDNNKVYDGTSDGTIKNIKFKTATTGRGVVSGDTVALSTTTVSGTYINGSTAVKDNSVTNSATGKWKMVRKSTSALTLTNNPNSNYYLDVEDYDGAIAQRYVDVYSNNNDKVYDRTSNGTIKNIAFVAPTADRGVISGDTVTLNTTTVNGFYTTNGSTKTANNSITNNSGNDWTMIRDTATSPLTISSSKNNYLLGNESYTGGITQRYVDVYSNNNDKVYDRTSNGIIKNIAFVAPTADRGVISGDTVTLNTTTVNGFYTTNGSTKTANNSITNNSGNDWTMIRDTATSPLTINSSYNNYLLGNETYTGGIAQRPLDVYSYDNNKVYDGTSDGTIKNIKFKTATTGRGVVSGDTVALSTTTVSGTYMNGSTAVKNNSVTNSATGKWDMVRKSTSALTLTNNPNSNYYLDVEDYDGAITQRPLDVYSYDNNKVYDGTSDGTIKNIKFKTATTGRGVVSGDTVALSTTTVSGTYMNGSTAVKDNSVTNSATGKWKMVRKSTEVLTLTNNPFSDYYLDVEDYDGAITQIGIVVHSRYLDTPDSPRNIKEYDGTASAVIEDFIIDGILAAEEGTISVQQTTINGTYEKAEAGETLNADGTVQTDRFLKLEEYTITPDEGAKLTGNEKGNYYIEKEEYSGAIYRTSLNVSINNWSGIFGTGMPEEAYASADAHTSENTKPDTDSWLTIEGLKHNDEIVINTNKSKFVAESLATPQILKDTDVGIYELTYEGLTEANYPVLSSYIVTITNGTLEVSPREILIDVNDADKMFGEDNPDFYSTFFFIEDDGTKTEIGSDEVKAYDEMALVTDDTVLSSILVKFEDGTTEKLRMVMGQSNIAYVTECDHETPAIYLPMTDDYSTFPCEFCEEYYGFESGTAHWKLDGYEVAVNTDITKDTILEVAYVTNAKGEQVQNYVLKYETGEILVHPEIPFQLKATVPMYVCMYGYRASGNVITPSEYGITNNSNGDIKVTDIEVSTDGWTITPDVDNLKAGELYMKMNDTVLSLGHNKPFAQDNWIIPQGDIDNETGYYFDLPLYCRVAGGNVNEADCEFVTGITFTITKHK